jgi:hypothetical protein
MNLNFGAVLCNISIPSIKEQDLWMNIYVDGYITSE